MLVLSREVDERIVFVLSDGQEIFVQVVAIRGDKARLGIEAPLSIQVHREEVWDAIKRESAAEHLSEMVPIGISEECA